MRRYMRMGMVLCAAAIALYASARDFKRVATNHPDKFITGDEINRVQTAPPTGFETPVVDTIGNVFRAGTTWYDLQHNGTIGRMIELDDSNNVHVVWMRAIDSAVAQRQSYYNLLDHNTMRWVLNSGTPIPLATVTRSGFVNMTMLTGNRAMPAHHETVSGNSVTRSNTYFDVEPLMGAFIAYDNMPSVLVNGSPVSAIWPRIQMGRNGRVHVVSYYNPSGASDQQFYHRGVYDSQADQITWSPAIQLPGLTENIAAEVVASRHTNRAAVAWMRPMAIELDPPGQANQVSNNVVVARSPDGDTWDFNNFSYITNWRNPRPEMLPDLTAANGDTFRAYNDINGLFVRSGQADRLHVLFTAGLFYRFDQHDSDSTGAPIMSDSSYYVFGSIWHWREDDSLRIVKVADGGNPWTELLGRVGAWNRTVHRPQLSEASNGDLYVSFAGCYDPRDTTALGDVSLAGFYNFDIYITKSTDGGYHWRMPTNVTHTRTPDAAAGQCRSEMWNSANRWTDNYVHLTYITDKDAGTCVQTEGIYTLNDFNYQRVPVETFNTGEMMPYQEITFTYRADVEEEPIGALPSGITIEGNYPNPFNPTTDIFFTVAHASPITLRVYDLMGREIAKLEQGRLNAGKYRVPFSGADLSSGIYFVRLSDGKSEVTHKITLLK